MYNLNDIYIVLYIYVFETYNELNEYIVNYTVRHGEVYESLPLLPYKFSFYYNY